MAEIKIITEKNDWQNILAKHHLSDVYVQYDYVKPMADHLKAKPILINYRKSEDIGFVYSLLISDISNSEQFSGILPDNQYFDAETPYGYGGPFFYGNFTLDEEEQMQCKALLNNALKEQGIISQFIRFYPLFFREDYSTLITDRFGTYKSTIYMDLESEETVLANLDSQYRRKIRKAKEAGVNISFDKGEKIEEFIKLYNMTMKMHNAEDMYFFGNQYYQSLIDNFSDNLVVFYATIDGKTVGSSIFLFDSEFMHFHLGGRDIDAPNVPFENLLMVEAALWGSRNGIKKLHIGGGLSDEDSLFQYKKKFNRAGSLPFYIGRTILDKEKYDELMHLRETSDPTFNPNNNFFIQYRF